MQNLKAFPGLPKLNAGQPQMPALTPPPNPNNYPFARGTEQIRNTNPFQQQYRRYQRENADYLQQNSALDPALRAELEKFGDYYKRQYLAYLQAGDKPNEKGETQASQYLDYLRVARDERMQKWVDAWGHLDQDTQNAFNRFAKPFQEAYTDAILAGQDTVIMNVGGQDVEMRGYDAAKEIYRQAILWNQQEVARKRQEAFEQAGKMPWRTMVGGY